MKKIFLLIITLLVFTSCVTQKACNRKFPLQENVITTEKIVVRDSIVYKPVEVLVPIKGDTVTKYITVVTDSKTGLVNSKPVYAETEFAKAVAQVKRGELYLELIQKDSILKVTSDSLVKEVYYWKEKYNTTEKTVAKKEYIIPTIYKISMAIVVLTLIVILIVGIIKLNKFKLL